MAANHGAELFKTLKKKRVESTELLKVTNIASLQRKPVKKTDISLSGEWNYLEFYV